MEIPIPEKTVFVLKWIPWLQYLLIPFVYCVGTGVGRQPAECDGILWWTDQGVPRQPADDIDPTKHSSYYH